MRERRLRCIVWSVVILTALVIAVLATYLCGWPRWCTDQVAAWTGIATGLGALAMALTALLILEQITLQAKTVEQIKEQVGLQAKTTEMQDRQLKYYYLPAVCLQVHYDAQNDRTGVPIAFMTVNQAPVFKIDAWIDVNGVEPQDQRHMGDTHPSGFMSMYWDAGVIYPGQRQFGLFGPLEPSPSPRTIVVRWQQTVTAERWEQKWRLWSGEGAWFVSPDGPAGPASS